MSNIALPQWLEQALPQPTVPHRLIATEDNRLCLMSPMGEMSFYETLKEAHEAMRDLDVSVAESVYDLFGDGYSLRGLGLTYPSDQGGFTTMVLTNNDEQRRKLLQYSWEASQKCAVAYEEDPTSFYNSYHFVDTHPAFWVRNDAVSDPWWWQTSGHCERVSQFVMKIEREEENPEAYPQGYVIALETGGHVPTEDLGGPSAYTTHFHDYRLDVYGLTFEAAFIELAKQVHLVFNNDGSEREDVELEKPEWLQVVEERAAEAQAALEAEDSSVEQ